jgi:hypothetical protein
MVDSASGFWRVAAGLAVSGLAACGTGSGGDPGASCPAPPASCPSPEPSWSTDVQPIVNRSCAPCHFPGGRYASKFNFSTYAGVSGPRGSVLDALSKCLMPLPGGNVPLAPADREKMLAWLVCGAPQN